MVFRHLLRVNLKDNYYRIFGNWMEETAKILYKSSTKTSLKTCVMVCKLLLLCTSVKQSRAIKTLDTPLYVNADIIIGGQHNQLQ